MYNHNAQHVDHKAAPMSVSIFSFIASLHNRVIMAFQTIWEYRVCPEHVSEFISAYSSDGDWAVFFSRSPGYLKTELMQDETSPTRFITIDYWESCSAYKRMKKNLREEYEKLDKKFNAYTLSENHLGTFLTLI